MWRSDHPRSQRRDGEGLSALLLIYGLLGLFWMLFPGGTP